MRLLIGLRTRGVFQLRVRLPDSRTVAVVAPLLALVAYLVVFAIRLPQFYVDSIEWSSDATTYMLLSKTIAEGIHGPVYLSYAPWYSTILIDVITYHLPGFQTIWALWPAATYVSGVSLLSLTVGRLFSRWAALMTTILCLALSPPMLVPTVAQAFHELTVFNCILLAVFLVRLAEKRNGATWITIAATAALGIFTGVNAASDALLIVTGIVPFGGVTLILLARYRDHAATKTAILCLGVIVIAIGAGCLTEATGNALLLIPHAVPIGLVQPNNLLPHLELVGGLLWEEIDGAHPPVASWAGPAELAIAVAGLCLIATGVVLLVVQMLRFRTIAPVKPNRGLQAHFMIWGAIATADFCALAFTTVPLDLNAVRYAIILWIAGAASVPLLFARNRRLQLGFALLVTTLVALHAMYVNRPYTAPSASLTAAVAYLQSQHVRYGYADYWDANSISWLTQSALTLRPASSCDARGTLCATEFGIASSWYASRPGWSAVILDPSHTLTVPPVSAYGKPRETHTIGRLVIYIYDHDLGPIRLHPLP
jgi:hypothetical protein